MIYLVTIKDKTLYGEPDVAISVVQASDEEAVHRAAATVLEELGCGRCISRVQEIDLGRFYRIGAMLRLPKDPNAC